ncbi:hypothetical protein [Streptosporangium sp. KLBMP 9127]|nr:hypothetical protein [Streptosporangium sp. KLBMP 9127]
MVQATGSTVGLPGPAGRKVRIDGAGSQFDGTHFVTVTQHSLRDSGYRPSFDCRREDLGDTRCHLPPSAACWSVS